MANNAEEGVGRKKRGDGARENCLVAWRQEKDASYAFIRKLPKENAASTWEAPRTRTLQEAKIGKGKKKGI